MCIIPYIRLVSSLILESFQLLSGVTQTDSASRRISIAELIFGTFGIGVFPLIAIRGSETLTVGIGVFPLIAIRGSFIVAVLSRVRYCENVLYSYYRHSTTPRAIYSGKNLKLPQSRHKLLTYKDLRQKRPPFGAVSRFAVWIYVILDKNGLWRLGLCYLCQK